MQVKFFLVFETKYFEDLSLLSSATTIEKVKQKRDSRNFIRDI